jgi:hypothetical protein
MKALPASSNPEAALQEDGGAIIWLVFHAFGLWAAFTYWLRWKRVCAWHEPRPVRMGGNPFAPHVTHGICPKCFARVSDEIISKDDIIAGCRPVRFQSTLP